LGRGIGKEVNAVEKDFADWVYQSQRMHTLENDKLKIYQSDDETEEAFRMRLQVKAREERDAEVDELHEKYDAKFSKLDDKIRKEERDLEEAKADKRGRRNDELINVVETVFGSVFGGRRRRSSSSVTTKRRMARKAAEKVEESEEDLYALDRAKEDLTHELDRKLREITSKWDDISADISKKEIKPRRTDVKTNDVIVAWCPFWVGRDGEKVSAMQ